MSTLQHLQQWYRSHCNEAWEHSYGVKIDNLDNPGWTLTIDLIDTELADRLFVPISYGIGQDSHPSGEDWLFCKVEKKKFEARGGPYKLEEMISIFLKWAGESSA